MRPMLPSWIRSRNWSPRFVYFLAMEMTSRRLASTISFLARAALASPERMSFTMRLRSSARVWASSSARRIFCWATHTSRSLIEGYLPAAFWYRSRSPSSRADSHLARLVEAFLALAQEPVDCSKLAHHRAPEVGLLLLGELLFGIVHQVLDGDEVLAEVVADDADLLDGQGGREDGTGRLVLALLDALGQRDLALAREKGDAPHLAQVEPDGVFRAPHGARR